LTLFLGLFLLEVLQNLGFGQIWRDILSGLLATSSTQVLLNGSLGGVIHIRRGLRQGDPLSPMLFILVMDMLGFLVAKAEEGLLQPLSSRPLHHRISLYADDVQIVMSILKLFGEASGLVTNVQKSRIYPIRCSEEVVALQQHLPCEISSFPCTYLGLPLSLKRLSRGQVQPNIDKVADQLPGWKAELMTKAGRKVHVQFVMTGIENHNPNRGWAIY
jgi:hypothetical protein